jgi:hypothetical protein
MQAEIGARDDPRELKNGRIIRKAQAEYARIDKSPVNVDTQRYAGKLVNEIRILVNRRVGVVEIVPPILRSHGLCNDDLAPGKHEQTRSQGERGELSDPGCSEVANAHVHSFEFVIAWRVNYGLLVVTANQVCEMRMP